MQFLRRVHSYRPRYYNQPTLRQILPSYFPSPFMQPTSAAIPPFPAASRSREKSIMCPNPPISAEDRMIDASRLDRARGRCFAGASAFFLVPLLLPSPPLPLPPLPLPLLPPLLVEAGSFSPGGRAGGVALAPCWGFLDIVTSRCLWVAGGRAGGERGRERGREEWKRPLAPIYVERSLFPFPFRVARPD